MKRTLAMIGLAALMAGCAPEEPKAPLVGKVAPDFSLPPAKPAGDVRLQDLKGKVVLLDFWATWCGPCRQIMPWLSTLHAKHRDEGLVVIGVTDESPETVNRFKAAVGDPGYELVIDAKKAVNVYYGVTNLPTTVLIGRDGIVREVEVGVDPEQGMAEMEKAVLKALAEKG